MAPKRRVLPICHIDVRGLGRLQRNGANLRLVVGIFSRKIVSSSQPVAFMPSIRSSKFRFALVVSIFNREYTDALLASAQAALQVQRLARAKRHAAVIALGVIWQGKTLHAQEILRAVTDALMRISLETDVPVVHEVLAVSTEAEARARCMGTKFNRGREAAQAALALALSDRVKGSR